VKQCFFIALAIVFLLFPQSGVCQSSAEILKKANEFFDTGNTEEGQKLFVEGTKLYLNEAQNPPKVKVQSALVAAKYCDWKEKRFFYVAAAQIAQENSLEYLLFDELETISQYYYELSYKEPDFYISGKAPVLDYIDATFRVLSIDSTDVNKHYVTIAATESYGLLRSTATLITEKDGKSYGFTCNLENDIDSVLYSQDSVMVYSFDRNEVENFSGFGKENIVYASMRVPEFGNSFLEQLFFNQGVRFTGNYRKVIHSMGLLLHSDYQLIKPIVNQFYINQLLEVYEEYKEDSVMQLISNSGAFKGEALGEIFRATEYEDINLFLEFVSFFPKKYWAKDWSLAEVYATWIINDAPLGTKALTRFILEAKERDKYLLKYKDEVFKEGLFTYWKEVVANHLKSFRYQEALSLQKLIYDAAVLYDTLELAHYAALDLAEIYKDLNHFQAYYKYLNAAAEQAKAAGINYTPQAQEGGNSDLNLVVQANHSVPYQLIYHPNGKYFYTTSWDGKIKVWDASINKLIREYRAHNWMVKAIAVKSDGTVLATGDEDGIIKLWRINGSELQVINTFKYEHSINEFVISSSDTSTFMAICGGSNDVLLYDWEENKTKYITKHKKAVSALTFSTNGQFLFTGGRDSMIYKWDMRGLSFDTDDVLEWDHWYKETGQIFQIDISENNALLAAITSDSSLQLWDIVNHFSIGDVPVHMYQRGTTIFYSPAVFSSNNKYLCYTENDNLLSIIDLSNFKIRHFNHNQGTLISDIDFHPGGDLLATTSFYNSDTKFWDLSKFDVFNTESLSTKSLSFTSTKAYRLSFNSSGTRLLSTLSPPSGQQLTQLNLQNGEQTLLQNGMYSVATDDSFTAAWIGWDKPMELHIQEEKTHKSVSLQALTSYTIDFNSYQYFLSTAYEKLILYDVAHTQKLYCYDIGNQQLDYVVDLEVDSMSNYKCFMAVSNDIIYLSTYGNKIHRYRLSNGEKLKSLRKGLFNEVYSIKQHSSNELLCEMKWNLRLIETTRHRTLWKYRYKSWNERKDGEKITSYKLSRDGKYLSYSDYYYTLYVLDAAKKFSTLVKDQRSNWFINDIAFHPNMPLLAYCNEENVIRLLNYKQDKVLLNIYPQEKGSFVLVDTNNHYWASKQDLKNIAFELGGKIYPAEQFDALYNRPDIVLNSLPTVKEDFKNAITLATTKRMKRLQATSADIRSFPNVNLKNKGNLPTVTKDTIIPLKIEAFDFNSELQQLTISVNGVIVQELELHSQAWDSVVRVALISGRNEIKIFATNKKGLTSLRENVEIQCGRKAKTSLYLFALSVSKYKDSSYNLNYAVKDGRDLVNAFVSKSAYFDTVYVDTFFNERVTIEALDSIENRLKEAGINDQVILFVSGHGLLDDAYDFYFAGHQCNFDNPSEGGISYAAIEKALESTRALERLLLMDACHSGEVDKEEMYTVDTTWLANGRKSGLKSYSYRGAGLELDKEESLGLQNSFELMKELFSDFNTNGTQVISAASGDSYALESAEWQNGVFTYSILDGLINEKADLDKNGNILVSELKEYVAESVYNLTGGQQKPTSRQENIEFDFNIW
jgi:WD40 repeat protein